MEGCVFHFVECSQNLQTTSFIQRNITKDYPIAKPLKYLPPYPKRGPDLFCPITSILLFGIWVQLHGLSPDGLSVSARETIFDRAAPGDLGWPGVHGRKLDSWWESIMRERNGGLQVRRGHWTSTSKCGSGKIRCPHGCSYQDRISIYCKQSITPVT